MSAAAYLPCPECGEDAVPCDRVACLSCEYDGEHECDVEPLWTDETRATCPGCGTALRVAADGEHAWAEVAA